MTEDGKFSVRIVIQQCIQRCIRIKIFIVTTQRTMTYVKLHSTYAYTNLLGQRKEPINLNLRELVPADFVSRSIFPTVKQSSIFITQHFLKNMLMITTNTLKPIIRH